MTPRRPPSAFIAYLQCLFAILALTALPLHDALAAASTSATINGSVVDQTGQLVRNAEVKITNEPTGSTKTITTGDNGTFYQAGLRVGGPYTIAITAPGYQGAEARDLYLRPGEQAPLRFRLLAQGATVEELVVKGERIAVRDMTNGVGSAYTAEDISDQPSTQRDVIRTLLRDPLAQSDGVGNLSVGGVNSRFNGLAIDGSLQQDDFGLGSNTYATERSPINLDAVESASLEATDYSVTVSGFTGGLVNITTKSGTNDFDGSAFYYYADQDYVGDKYDGGNYKPGDFKEKERGVTLGGPIIKDRLFFFGSYDEYTSASSVDFASSDAQNGVQPGFFDALSQVIQTATGYDPGTRPGSASTPVESKRTLLKLDANITDSQRASFTYQKSEETGTSVSSTSFEGAWYDTPVELEAYTGQLFSDWTPQLSTTLRYNHKKFSRGQICRAGAGVGEIRIQDLDPADLVGTPLDGLLTRQTSFTAGCDRFRHANVFDDERTQVFGSADYQWGDHVTTAGAEYENYKLFNLFVDSSRGSFVYDGYADLVAGTATVNYRNAPTNNANDAASSWEYDKYSLFAQDRWQLRPDLEVTYGVRYERYDQSDKPAFSQPIKNTYGVNTSMNLDGLDIFEPRVSFRWDYDGATTLSGGFGLFSGGEPQVWISNAFQPPTVFASTTLTGADVTSVPQSLQDTVAAGTALPIDSISGDFKIPADWKASLKVDHTFDAKLLGVDLGSDYTVTAQVLYTRVDQGFLWTNLAQTDLAAALPTGVAPDGRRIYADLQDLGILNQTQLGNYDKGQSYVYTLGLSKHWDSGIDMSVSYAFQDVEATTEGTSSRGISNWRGITATDRNNPTPRPSPFEVKHSFKFSFGYEHEFFRGLATRVDVFGRLFKSDPFTYTFDVSSSNALFGRAGGGESPFDNNPLYVPKGPSDPLVVFGAGFDQAAFFSYLDRKGVPSGVNTPYGESGGWNNIWDLRFQQELPGIPGIGRLVGENHLKLVVDVDNFLNLINSDWGKYTNGPSNGQLGIVQADLVSAADVAMNGIDGATALTGDAPRTTCTTQSACVYRFDKFRGNSTSFTSGPSSVYRIRIGLRMDF